MVRGQRLELSMRNMLMSRVFISAAHKSSGKTIVGMGLCAALAERGYAVQPFKKGPDYIDPLWLTLASGRCCYNLDFNTQTHDEIHTLWKTYHQQSDLGFIEGNKGLFDGVDPDGSDCNAALAKYLDVPVVLVIDAQGITRGIAPLIMGYRRFDPDVEIIGVILNKVAGQRHEGKLRRAVQKYINLPVLGAIHRHADLVIDERHLGLVPGNEYGFAGNKINLIKGHIENRVDMGTLAELLQLKKPPVKKQHKNDVLAEQSVEIYSGECETRQRWPKKRSLPGANKHFEDTFNAVSRRMSSTSTIREVRIGVARDSAFGFYYQDDLDKFAGQGAELVCIDLIHDAQLPEIDGLIIGGGFPETHMRELSRNSSMCAAIKEAVHNSLPVYGECGGLMYLCRGIKWQGEYCKMSSAIAADVLMHQSPQGRGYTRLRSTGKAPWQPSAQDKDICAHEFHHSSLENVDDGLDYAYEVQRGHGIDGGKDGIIFRNTVAGYAHLRSTRASPWVEQFVKFVKRHRKGAV